MPNVKNGYRSHRGRSAIARNVMHGTFSHRFTNRPQGGGIQTKWDLRLLLLVLIRYIIVFHNLKYLKHLQTINFNLRLIN